MLSRMHYATRWIHLLLTLLTLALLAACQPVQPPDAAAPALTPTRVVAPLAPRDAGGDWERIAQAGRLVVGTSADFPPFSYYDETFHLAGYDPALLEALGKQLGLEVVFKDFAFEGLPAALDLGQIDVAAASLTVTPERAARVDFTLPYFATSEGFLAPPGAAADSIGSLEELAGRRIGVERGSVYASWLRRGLVDAGLSTEQELILYATGDSAAADLLAGRIDLLVTDLPAAQQLARRYGLLLAGQGLLAQQYALALRPAADELRSRLDGALAALAANGTLARLGEQQLGLDAAQWIAPAAAGEGADAPAAAAGEGDGCVDGLALLEDLSLPDQGMTTPAVMAPAQPFSKTWRVLNTGSCTWGIGYQLVFAHGSAAGAGMGGQPVSLGQKVAPGETAELSAALVAPITPGVYQGAWQLQDADGRGFGERLRVGIQVAGVPTPTPGPTQTPVAGVTFYADAERVRQGSPVTLRWDVAGAEEVYFYQAGQGAWASHQVEAQGERTLIPPATTTYQLRVVRAGQAEDRLLTVYVEPNPALPQVVQFALAPSGELALGQCVTLTWQVEGDIEQAALFRDKEAIWEDAPLAGTFADCPPAAGEYEYAVGAQGPGGRNYAVAALRVLDAGAADAGADAGAAEAAAGAAAGAGAGPAIDRFSVLPEELTVGGCVELQWAVSSETQNIQVLRDGAILLDGAPAAGSGSDCPSEPGLRRYQLAASDRAGQTSVFAVNVWVTAPPSTPAPAATPEPAPAAPVAPVAPGQETPAGRQFLLIAYRNAAGEMISPLTGTQITLAFGVDGAVSGAGGCNQYSSRYEMEGRALTIAPVAATEMFCAEPIGLMDQEEQVLNLLPAAAGYRLEVGQLTLLDGAGNTIAVLVMVE